MPVLMSLSCKLHDDQISQGLAADWLESWDSCRIDPFCNCPWLLLGSAIQERTSEKEQPFWLFVSDRHTCQACTICTFVSQKVIFKQDCTTSVCASG